MTILSLTRRGLLALFGAAGVAKLWGCSRNNDADSAPLPGPHAGGGADSVTLFLAGDVMTGRGIDQILPYPVDPVLYEPYATSAEEYVRLAERANGPIPERVSFEYVWGAALGELERVQADARIVNLETSVTTSEDRAAKGIHYRMHPDNVPVLTAAGIDCCVLGNNHVLDWGSAGLLETLAALRAAGVRTAGAGRNLDEARAPAVLELPEGGRVLVFSFGATTSGIPRQWAAAPGRPGVNLLPEPSAAAARDAAARIREARKPGDLVVASVHWGGNWGYAIPKQQVELAHALVDEAGVDVVHGHSSHHAKAIEVYAGKPILYGCGDFLNDYEGISGREEYRGELPLAYFVTFERRTGRLARLEMTPFCIRRFQLQRASDHAARWLANTLDRECRRFGGAVVLDDRRRLRLRLPMLTNP